MKVLLIQQEIGRRKLYPNFPIGLCYIATSLKEHEVKIFDPNVYDFTLSCEKLKEEVINFKPEAVGISIRDIDSVHRRHPFVHFKTIRSTIRIVKDINSEMIIIAGGPGFSIYAKEIMDRLPEVDFGIYLEGEESFPELLMNLNNPEMVKGIFFRKNGRVGFTGARQLLDFSDLPIPRRDSAIIDIRRYIAPQTYAIGVQSKRGCVFDCAYCTYTFLNGRKIRLRDPISVVDEIEQLRGQYNVRKFTFVDNIFNVPEKHALDVCREIIKRNLDVEWEAWFSLNNFSEEFLLLARKAGCRRIEFSPDAATDKGLASLKKGITEKDIEKSLKILNKIKGISVGYCFFCCYPGQNLKGLLKTLLLMFKVPLMLLGRGGVGFGWIRIEPYTDIYQLAINEGIIDRNANLLPENEDDLSKLFYAPSSQKHITMTMDIALTFVESIIEPIAKLFRMKRS